MVFPERSLKKLKIKRKIALTVGAACLALPMAALASCEKSGAVKIKLSEVTHSVFYAPMYLAEALGYYGEEGIEIELSNAGGADSVMAAVLSGDADIGFCGPEAALYVLAGGSTDSPKVFGQLTKRDGSFLVSRKDEPNFKWSDLEGKEILAGRKGGMPAMTFEYILGGYGLENGQNVTMNFDVAFNLMTGAFEAGTGDYCTMFEPVASEYEKAGKGYIVASVGVESGEVPYTAYMAKESWLKENSSVAEGFLASIIKAMDYIAEEPSSSAAELLAPYFAGTDVESIAVSLDSYKAIDAWQMDMCMKEESFLRMEKIIDGAGELPAYVEFTALVDNSYAENAGKRVGK